MTYLKSAGFEMHVAVCICVPNRSHCAWGKTGGAGGMKPPFFLPKKTGGKNPTLNGQKALARQETQVGCCASHQSTVAGGSWSSAPPSPCSPAWAPRRQGNRRGEEVKRQERTGDMQHNRLLWSKKDTSRGETGLAALTQCSWLQAVMN